MEPTLATYPIPQTLETGKLYYLVAQKSRYTSWVYLGTQRTGEWFKNRGTGADFFVPITEVREIPETEYRYLNIPRDGFITAEEISKINTISEYNKKFGTKISQRAVDLGEVNYEAMRVELYGDVSRAVTDEQYYTTQTLDKTTTKVDIIQSKETPGPEETKGWDTPEQPKNMDSVVTKEMAKQIIATLPAMAEAMYELYPDLKPNVPAVWEVIKVDTYKIDSETMIPSRCVFGGSKVPSDLDATYVGMPEYLPTMNAIRKMSFLSQVLPIVEVGDNKPFYTIVLNSASGGVEVIPTEDVVNPFVFVDEQTGKDFVRNNQDIITEYFSFVNKIFK